MRKAMYEIDSDADTYGYRSVIGDLRMYRDKKRLCWILERYGVEIDSDRYRNDIAERHNLHLRYSDGLGGWV